MRFEIWKDAVTGETACCAADASGDRCRALISNAVLVHEFDAATLFETKRIYHEVLGYEPFETDDPFYFEPLDP